MKLDRLILLPAVFCMAQWALAQVETSTSIRGLVTDSTGASVAGAEVRVRNVANGEQRSTVSDGTGFYAFPSIVPGTYDITVTHPGFKRAEVTNRVAQVSQSAQVDVALQVGENTESVTVSAQGAELLATASAEVAGTIVNKLVADLPLNGRNFFDLAVTLPHVSLQNLGPQVSFAGFAQNVVFGANQSNPVFRSSGLFAAGNRDSATNVSLDGMNIQGSNYGQATPQQPPAAIEEVKIHVSGMNAEFGYGVAHVNVITKEGTNRYHGEAYEFLQNEKLDANYFFNNLNGRDRSPYRQNQFGGALGGPVLANRLFFFAAYEGLRVRQSTVSIQTVPPADLRNGDFSNFHPPGPGGTVLPTPTIYNPYQYNPASGQRTPFPNNRIPVTSMDPITLKFVQDWVPLPNAVIGGIPQRVGNTTQVLNQDQGVTRVDWVHGSNQRVYGRYSRVVSPSIGTGLQSLEGLVQNASDQGVAVHWTQILSPSTVNDVMGGFSRPYWYYGRDMGVPDVSAAIGLKNTAALPGGPSFSGTGYTLNASATFALETLDNTFQLGDDITHVTGRHSLKFGVQAVERRFHFPTRSSSDKGFFAFSPVFTQACPAGNAACAALGASPGGNAFATYLLGASLDGLFQLNGALYQGHRRYYGAYAQDSWRVNARLTLNYGVRYDYWSPWLVPRNTVISYDPKTGNPVYVLQNPIDYLDPKTNYGRNAPLNPNVPRSGYATSNLNFSPRVGLAYSLTPKTVFRAGYGIYYNGNINMNQFSDISTNIGPFRLRSETISSASDQVPTLLVNGNFQNVGPTTIPQPNANPPATFRFIQDYYPLENVQEWSATIQQRLSTEWAVEVSYEGTHAIHLDQFIDANAPALPQGGLAQLSLQRRRPFPQWGILGTWAPMGYGRYHGGAVTLRNNTWHGLTLLSSFTFAKNIVSSLLGVSDQGNQSYQVPYLWRGPAQLTPRLRFVNSFSYDLPLGPGKALGGSAFAKALLGGWNVSCIIDMTTGPYNQVTTDDLSGTGYGVMPNRICDARNVPGGRSRFEWFNTGCFAEPAFGTWGNSNFGVYEDPGINNWNLSLAKTTRTRLPAETGHIVLRMDLFNAWNHTQWGNASNSTLQSGNVNSARILSTRPPRQIQFSLTYLF